MSIRSTRPEDGFLLLKAKKTHPLPGAFRFGGFDGAYQPRAGLAFVCFVICFSSSQTVRPVFTCTSDIWNE